jgi:endonuclease/exonuclease/phosphatase family metal-dependent hydrolase
MKVNALRMAVVGVVVGTSLSLSGAPANAEGDEVNVMIRNIYLGADVSVALDLIPDLPAAAQFMWDQVAATNFTQRAPVLANELAREQPAVVGIQEATVWECRSGLFGESTVIFNFLDQLLEATKAAGVEYVIAAKDGNEAVNPGYTIPAIPFLTNVNDPITFQPIFGSDSAACGFTISDALLVRADLATDVVAVGTGDYQAAYAVVPVIFEVTRGYAWADLKLPQGTTRFVTTHLESVWDPDSVPVGAQQANELVAVASEWTMPLVVMGDFNADPRDPRPEGASNPGEQPDTTTGCEAQADSPTAESANATCNAYWAMINAGFVDAGPDPLDPTNYTWGAEALLAGPDLARLAQVKDNPFGYSDRFDYIFVRNGVTVDAVKLIGASWPQADDLWACTDPRQLENARLAAEKLGISLGEKVCLPTDHVGLLATLSFSNQSNVAGNQDSTQTTDESAESFQWEVVLAWVIIILTLVGISVVALRRRRMRLPTNA